LQVTGYCYFAAVQEASGANCGQWLNGSTALTKKKSKQSLKKKLRSMTCHWIV
jgi:hypothetical protein